MKSEFLFIAAALAAFFISESARAETTNEIDEWDINNPPPFDVPIPEIDYMENKSIEAFLYMIRSCEIRNVPDDERYNVFFGGSRFYDLSDHPVITGEKVGVPLSAAMCRAAGFNPGCVSTAAGAGQIIKPTWQRWRSAGSWGPRLPDFSPESQNEAMRRGLIECGAYPLILAGDINGAIRKASALWASLPGSVAGQPVVSLADARAYFDAYMVA